MPRRLFDVILAATAAQSQQAPLSAAESDPARVRVHEPAGVFHRRGSTFRWSTPVPVPPRARPSGGDDLHVVIWQPSSDTMWEFWDLRITPDATVVLLMTEGAAANPRR